MRDQQTDALMRDQKAGALMRDQRTDALMRGRVWIASLLAAVLLAAGCGGVDRDGLTVLSAKSSSGTLVIFLSGIGGFEGGVDRRAAERLAEAGHAVIGLDSPVWFARSRPPAEVAARLSALIETHAAPSGASRTALAGYSFGANALPPAYNALDAETRDAVDAIILIAPNRRAREIIDLAALTGVSRGPIDLAPEIARLPRDRLACIYPEAERARSGCTLPETAGAAVTELPGGHTFNRDDALLAGAVEAVLAAPAGG